MRLNYSEQNKGSLAIVDNWTSYKYGLSTRENILPYEINIMNNLNFIYMFLDIEDFPNSSMMRYTQQNGPLLNLQLKIVRGWFHYKGRAFAIHNNSFEKFLKKIKKRYQRKIALKKNPINLRNREIMGKFKF